MNNLKRTVEQLENKLDKITELWQGQERSAGQNMQLSELELAMKTVSTGWSCMSQNMWHFTENDVIPEILSQSQIYQFQIYLPTIPMILVYQFHELKKVDFFVICMPC